MQPTPMPGAEIHYGLRPTHWMAVPIDGLSLTFPAIFHGGFLRATAGGTATVTIRDGHGTNGQAVWEFEATVSSTDMDNLVRGIRLQRGLFVDVGANVSEFLLFYRTLERVDFDVS